MRTLHVSTRAPRWLGRPAAAVVAAAAALLLLPLAGCGDDDSESDDTPAAWCSTDAEDGHERCDEEGRIQRCHVIEGMDPHPHWGMDCSAYDLECRTLGDAAACVDPAATCGDDLPRCADNYAITCFDGGLAKEHCGTDVCAVEDGEAHCEEEHHEDPAALACEAIAGDEVEEVTAVADFADFPNAHVDLGHRARITLPAGGSGFVHFPGAETGEFVVFLDRAGAFVRAAAGADPDTNLPASDEGANGECAEALPEHWHIEVTNDSGEVKPQVLELTDTGDGVVELVILGAGEEEHDHEHEE